jgi:hypothetical protein
VHIHGKYYVGRHSTTNLDDGYLGSGNWIKSIKDKSSLRREILEYATCNSELKDLESKYLAENFGKSLCMNMRNSASGHTKESASKNAQEMVLNGTHPFLDKNAASTRQKILVEEGKHHFLSGDIQRKSNKNRLENGTHHLKSEINANYRRVSCLRCKQETTYPIYQYQHGPRCNVELCPPIELKLPGAGFKAGHASRAGKIGGIAGGEYAKVNKTGIHSLSKEKNMIRIYNSQITQAVRSGKASTVENNKLTAWPIIGEPNNV